MGEKRRKKRIIRLLKTDYEIGDVAPASAIYECSECGEITAFKQGERFLPCESIHDDEDDQHWYKTNQVVHFVSKNLNTEFNKLETFSLKLADFIADVSGRMAFIYFHIIWFWFWIHVNTGHTLFGFSGFDPYPFGLLTMIVSLEAIFLSTFILISQNRQSAKSELRAELDYQTNLKTEKDVAEVLSILHELREEGKLLEMETSEVLEDANIVLERSKKKKKKSRTHVHREKRAREIMKDAGIEHVHK
jgi:uncharacterized membrane protein